MGLLFAEGKGKCKTIYNFQPPRTEGCSVETCFTIRAQISFDIIFRILAVDYMRSQSTLGSHLPFILETSVTLDA